MSFQRYIRIFSASLALLGFSLLIGHEHHCHPDESSEAQSGSCWICKSTVDFDEPNTGGISRVYAPGFAEQILVDTFIFASANQSSVSSRAPPAQI